MKKYIVFAFAALSLAMTSCTEDIMDNINKRPDNPSDELISPSLQITDGIMATGFTTSSGVMAFYASSYTEQFVGVGGNQLMNAELRNVSQTASSSTFNNEWNGTYSNILNLKLALAKAQPGGKYENEVDVRGMIKMMLALNYGIMTDMFGDIPCSEAGVKGIPQPKVDKQEAIYTEIFTLIDGALADFKEAQEKSIAYAGSQDLLYKGDVKKWEAFAYALKARYKLHLVKVNAAAASEALAAAEKAKELGFEGADITGFTSYASSASNPWAAFWNDRNYNAASKTVDDLLAERNDPRRAVYSAAWEYDGKVLATAVATPGKEEDARLVYGTSEGEGFAVPAWLNTYTYPKAESASIHLLSKSELYFILAELKVRNSAEYKEDLTTAVEASFADYGQFGIEVTGTAADYVASLDSKLSANALKEVMIQKYLSQCRDEQVETYNDLRRMKALGEADSYVAMTNPKNTQSGENRWPVRLPYGNSDVIANPNVKALYGDGMYVFSENIWWAGGTR